MAKIRGAGTCKKLKDIIEDLEEQGYGRGEAIYFLQILLEDLEEEELEEEE